VKANLKNKRTKNGVGNGKGQAWIGKIAGDISEVSITCNDTTCTGLFQL